MKSIMQDKQDHTCYLCMMLHSDFTIKRTQEHHVIFGTANRKLSEKYGLKVYLCLEHHEEGREAVHRNAANALILKKEAQKVFEKRWPELDFRKVFGKNFLDDADRQQASEKEEGGEAGFQFLNTNLGKYSESEAAEALNYLAMAGYDATKSAETLSKELASGSGRNGSDIDW